MAAAGGAGPCSAEHTGARACHCNNDFNINIKNIDSDSNRNIGDVARMRSPLM